MHANQPATIYVECRRIDAEEAGYRGAQPTHAPCFELHRVEWLTTLETADTGQLLCRFRAPDAESVRTVFRNLGIPIIALWVQRESAALESAAPV